MPADFSPSAPTERAAITTSGPVAATVATLGENDRTVGSVDDQIGGSNRHG